VQRDRSRVVRTALPGRDRRGRATRAATDAIELDALPLAGRALQSGEPLRFVTWVCFPVAEKDSLFTARRWIARDGAALFRFGEPSVSRAGTCASVRDELDTTALAAGDYVYHLRRDTVSGPDEREVSFSIAAPEPASP